MSDKTMDSGALLAEGFAGHVAEWARRDPRIRADLRAAELHDEAVPLSPVHDAPDTRF